MPSVSTTQRLASAVLLAALLPSVSWSQPKDKSKKPPPDLTAVKYGPHPRNVLDLWKAKADGPTPLVVFIHGGGFRSGSKEALNPALLDGCLRAGISVMAINYRLSPEVHFPAHYLDCARAIQFARQQAKQWNVDPNRIAATGGSAGAGTSLWIGFHDDLADPESADPVLRQSTRLSCMAVLGAQSTYDPRVIKKIIGGRAHEHPALEGFYGLKSDELDTHKAHKLYEAASPVNYLSAADPPVYAFYNEPKGPLPATAKPGQGIHHINFGTYLKEKMDALKIECIVRHQEEVANPTGEMVAFFKKHLRVEQASDAKQGAVVPAFEAPKGWRRLEDNEFTLARFEIGADDRRALVTIAGLPGEGGGLIANLNRWRAQLDLKPLEGADARKALQPIGIDGIAGDLVEIHGTPPDGDVAQRILVVMVKETDRTWFFRISGPADLVAQERPNFTRFVASVRFRAVDKGQR